MDEVRAWLRDCGTETIEHPGGTLYAHLNRVHDRLAAFGHEPWVQLAGLTHAAYSTDGFDLALLDHTDRDTLRDLVGARAEGLVYRYGSCDRSGTYPALPRARQILNRWTGRAEPLPFVTEFADLSVINELDVCDQDPAILARHGDYFRETFAGWADVLSPGVLGEMRRVFG
ncbi:DUF6817 domain-containing protein [Actinoplanes sp. TFC3]|uniref:DUF6817 domain-containing protein n=1 Tax=Actinoplanes sp. TFC3 TaxID=1710355 RepID=UPI00082F7CF8|nr:hypothetical protein [Actinoplanes sp. TFC3]